MAKPRFRKDLNEVVAEAAEPIRQEAEYKKAPAIAETRSEIIATEINKQMMPRRQVPHANDERRNAITQIRFQQSVKDLAMNKAHSMGISLAEYLRILILKDNGEM